MPDEFQDNQKDEQQLAATRAVVELHRRWSGKEPVEPGTRAANGWSVAAHHVRDASPFAMSSFWAMLSPEEDRLVIIGHDELMTRLDVVTHDELKQYIEAAKNAASAVER